MSFIYLVELRRSPLRWCLPVLIVVDLAALFGRSRYWIGVWPQASAAAQIPSLFFGPALAAAAAWVAGRTHRRGIAEQIGASSRPVWHLEWVQLAATLTYGLVAYAVGALAAAAVSFTEAGPGFLWPGYLLLGVIVMVGCAGLGHAVGRWWRSRFSAPVICGIGSFLFIGWLGTSKTLAFVVLSAGPQLRIAPTALSLRLAYALALVAVAVLVPTLTRHAGAFGRRGILHWVAGVTALVAVGAAMIGIFTAGPLRVTRDAPRTPLCSTGTPKVCLWPEDRKYLPAIEAMIGRLRAIPGGILVMPDAFYERGLRNESVGGNDFEIIEGSTWSVSPNLAGNVIMATLPTFCPAADPAADERRTTAYFELGAWLEARLNGAGQPADVHGGPPGVDLAAVGRLITQPEDTQTAWLRQRLKTIRETPCA